MTILHLSDIHFGRVKKLSETEDIFIRKSEILQDLLKSIEKIQFNIEHIVVTGDIAWFGKKKDFNEALIWFRTLLSITNLQSKDITFCPGNHDVNRQYWNNNTGIDYNDIDKINQYFVSNWSEIGKQSLICNKTIKTNHLQENTGYAEKST